MEEVLGLKIEQSWVRIPPWVLAIQYLYGIIVSIVGAGVIGSTGISKISS